MEVSFGQKQRQEEFVLSSISLLSSSSSSSSSAIIARFANDFGVAVLRFHQDSESADVLSIDLQTAQVEYMLKKAVNAAVWDAKQRAKHHLQSSKSKLLIGASRHLTNNKHETNRKETY